jgi:hypothetical protein
MPVLSDVSLLRGTGKVFPAHQTGNGLVRSGNFPWCEKVYFLRILIDMCCREVTAGTRSQGRRGASRGMSQLCHLLVKSLLDASPSSPN